MAVRRNALPHSLVAGLNARELDGSDALGLSLLRRSVHGSVVGRVALLVGILLEDVAEELNWLPRRHTRSAQGRVAGCGVLLLYVYLGVVDKETHYRGTVSGPSMGFRQPAA